MPSGQVPEPFDDSLPSAAQEALDALRATFDERVNALEQALGNPQQAASLNTLVLELARVATDEADAAARQACLEAHLDAERSAAATIAQDRQTIASLRQAIDGAKIDLNGARADADRDRKLLAAAQRTIAELEQALAKADETGARQADERVAAAEARAAQADARVESARAHAAELEARAADRDARLREFELERGELLGVQKQLTSQLDRSKASVADLTARLTAANEQLARVQHDAETRATEQQTARQRAEKALQDSVSAASAAKAAREAAGAERDAAIAARDAAVFERDAARADRDTAAAERDAARAEAESLHRERDVAVADRDAAIAASDTASADRDRALGERDAARSAVDLAGRERDELRAARDDAARERDQAHSAREVASAELAAAHAARTAADTGRDALAAELVALKQVIAVRDRDASSQRVTSSREETTARLQAMTQERDSLSSRLQVLQEAVKTRDQDWTNKVRALEQKLRAAEEAARAAASTPASPGPKPAPAKLTVPEKVVAEKSTDNAAIDRPAAERPAAEKPAAIAKPASKQAGASATPAKRSALPPISRKALDRERAKPALPEPPPEPERPSVAEAFAALESTEEEAGSGVYSTVADALRAWSTEPVTQPAGPLSPLPSSAPLGSEPVPTTQTFEDPRRSRRRDVSDKDIRVLIDGETAQIVDLSEDGAQIVTSVMLKPGRHLKISFPSVGLTATAKGRIIWSRLEPPSAGHGVLTYRAGVAFTSIDPPTIVKLLAEAGVG